MKKLAGFIAIFSLAMLFGCTNDILTDENLELKKANVPIPVKGEVCMIDNDTDRIPVHFGSPDGPIVSGATVVRIAALYGNMSGMGKLDVQSWMEGHEGAYLDAVAYSEVNIIVVATYDARLIAANGDF